MRKLIIPSALVTIAVVFAATSSTAIGQWLRYPTKNIPRTANGKADLSAPAPRAADGKPDLSGLWLTDAPCNTNKDPEAPLVCGPELPMGAQGINFGFGVQGGLPYQPWLAKLVKER